MNALKHSIEAQSRTESQTHEHMVVDHATRLQDCASVSHSFFGYFLERSQSSKDAMHHHSQQLALLRSNTCLELYLVDPHSKLHLVCKYEVDPGIKVSNMIKVHKPGSSQDMIVLHMPQLKFATLCFD